MINAPFADSFWGPEVTIVVGAVGFFFFLGYFIWWLTKHGAQAAAIHASKPATSCDPFWGIHWGATMRDVESRRHLSLTFEKCYSEAASPPADTIRRYGGQLFSPISLGEIEFDEMKCLFFGSFLSTGRVRCMYLVAAYRKLTNDEKHRLTETVTKALDARFGKHKADVRHSIWTSPELNLRLIPFSGSSDLPDLLSEMTTRRLSGDKPYYRYLTIRIEPPELAPDWCRLLDAKGKSAPDTEQECLQCGRWFVPEAFFYAECPSCHKRAYFGPLLYDLGVTGWSSLP